MASERLGEEHDRRLIREVKRALRKMGARRRGGVWSLFGAQEVAREEWSSPHGPLILTGETYVGLVLEGSEEAIRLVKHHL